MPAQLTPGPVHGGLSDCAHTDSEVLDSVVFRKGKCAFDAKTESRDIYHKTAASLFRNFLLHPIVRQK